MAWAASLLDLVYPRACSGCGGRVGPDFHHVCWDCLSQVLFVQPPYCALCGDPVEGRVDHQYTCFHCSSATPHFDRARSAARYRGVVQELLREFKYRDALWLKPDLVRLLESCAAAHYDVGTDVDAVTSVPLYPARQRERGYNQAEILAGALARRLRKPLLSRCLMRVRPTQTQTHLPLRDRATNVRGAFRARRTRRLENQRVLLVDDVMTTGATVNECARALKEAGAARVYVVTVARG
jgi:competence protein ComFC